jgi:hypothetical protein
MCCYNDQEICESLLLMESAEIALINPLYPPVLGESKAGGHLHTPGRNYPAPGFSAVSYDASWNSINV